jgi:hypothetical protein
MNTTFTLADVEPGIEIPHMIGGKPYPAPADATLAPVSGLPDGCIAAIRLCNAVKWSRV